MVPRELRCAVDRWADEAAILLRAEGRTDGTVAVRFGGRRRLLLEPAADRDGPGPSTLRITPAPADGDISTLPVLPDAATWVLPDLDLIRTRSIEAGRLHPLVASALVPGHAPAAGSPVPTSAGQPHLVECRGVRHRVGLVDGVLVPLDHDPAETLREELLVALTGTPFPACGSSTRHIVGRTVWSACANVWSTVTPPVRWPSSRACWAARPCCVTALSGTRWRRPRSVGSPTASTGQAWSAPGPTASARGPLVPVTCAPARATPPHADPGTSVLRTHSPRHEPQR